MVVRVDHHRHATSAGEYDGPVARLPQDGPARSGPVPPRPGRQLGETRGQGRRHWLRGKAWLLLTLPLGFTTWAAFLYIGIRARRGRWLAWAGVYAATLAGYAALDTPAQPGNAAKSVAGGLALLTWIGG